MVRFRLLLCPMMTNLNDCYEVLVSTVSVYILVRDYKKKSKLTCELEWNDQSIIERFAVVIEVVDKFAFT